MKGYNFKLEKPKSANYRKDQKIMSLGQVLGLLIGLTYLMGCEDQINPTLEDAPPVVVVDAWLDNRDQPQIIRLTSSQTYFDNSTPVAINGAQVLIEDSRGTVYTFVEQADGTYQWTPFTGQRFGDIGLDFTLTIESGGNTYSAISTMNRVPTVDSITFRFEEENSFSPDGYFAEFWSRDPLGAGDTYWIKTYKNGEFLSEPDEINIAYDAGFTEGGNIDGLLFIPPIRDAINPFEEDEDDEFLSPYEDGDIVEVEIYSITNNAFVFLNETSLQIDRPGGFAELFATPLSNVPTNIISSDPDERVVGFFNVSAVERNSEQLDITQVPRDN